MHIQRKQKVILWFGLPANYMAHLVELLLGRENFSFGARTRELATM